MEDDTDDLQFDLLRPLVTRFLELYPKEEWGAGHVVLSDDNYDSETIFNCLVALNGANAETEKFLIALHQLNSILKLETDEDEKELIDAIGNIKSEIDKVTEYTVNSLFKSGE